MKVNGAAGRAERLYKNKFTSLDCVQLSGVCVNRIYRTSYHIAYDSPGSQKRHTSLNVTITASISGETTGSLMCRLLAGDHLPQQIGAAGKETY